MREPDFDAKFAVDGMWWLPETPSVKLPGTLLVEGGRDTRLKLFGALGDPSYFSRGLQRFPIILGTSDREEPCTLSDAYETRRPAEPERQTVAVTELGAERVYIGKHFPAAGDVRFTSMEVRYTDLEWWLGWTPFERQHLSNGFEWKLEQANLCRSLVDFADSARSTTLSIWSRVTEIFSFTEPGAEHKVYLRITPSAPSTFEWFFEYLFDVRNLFTLFIGSPIYIEMMTGFGDEVERAPGAKVPEEISIYFHTKPWPKKESRLPDRYACDI